MHPGQAQPWRRLAGCAKVSPMTRLGHLAARPLAAVLSGALLALALPAPAVWWLAWVGLVPLLLALGRAGPARAAAGWAWLAGSTFFLLADHWLVPSLGVFSVPVFALAGLLWVPFGLVARSLLARPPTVVRALAALAVLPCVWVAVEVLRSWKHLGGPWALLGATQWQVRPVLALAALGGVWLLSFVLVAANAGLAVALAPGSPGRVRLAGLAAVVVLAAAGPVYAASRPAPRVTGTLRVAGIQAGVVHDPAQRLAAHLRLTGTLRPGGHDVVVWGQSSVGYDPALHPEVAARLRAAARSAGTDLLVNVDARGPGGRITKSTRQFTAAGQTGAYAKQRLVPFGEYVPLRPLLGWVGLVSKAAEVDRQPGRGLVLLHVHGVAVGPLISYESAFPDLRRSLARRGAQVTLVQGATTTFQGSWAQPQQAAMEALRAVESGRPAVLVAESGVSAAFDPRGRRLIWVPSDQRRAFVVAVPLSAETTPYVRWGDWVPALALAVTATAVLGLLARPGRRRRSRQVGATRPVDRAGR
jgi:apolipoprotein N-acyltransferase